MTSNKTLKLSGKKVVLSLKQDGENDLQYLLRQRERQIHKLQDKLDRSYNCLFPAVLTPATRAAIDAVRDALKILDE